MQARTGPGRSGWPRQLTEAGYSGGAGCVGLGQQADFITKISDALERCDKVVALRSSGYGPGTPPRNGPRPW